jgi:Putative beta barrel porin-7 (BBP7)
MNIKTFLVACVALSAAVPFSVARSQNAAEAMVARTVSWITGDPAVLDGPSCDAAPQNYAEDTCCGDGNCGCCSQCCHSHDTWGSVEFLMWWAKGTPLPPLVTTSPVGTPQVQAGVLGFPTTSILFGDQLGANKMRPGGRVSAGIWLDPYHNVAVGGRFFGLGGDTTRFNQSSAGNPILGIPFFNALLNQQDALLIAYPGLSQGNINAYSNTNNIIGAEAFAEIMMVRDTLRRVDLVGGYQFLRLDDWFQINSNSTLVQAGNPLAGLLINVNDRFSTRNQFHGGEVGLRGRMARGLWSLNALGVVGLGNMNEQVTIAGRTVVTPAGGAPATNVGGLFAQGSNSGTFTRNKFAYIPQLTLNLNYHVNPCVSFLIGYNILWISDVALSGDQIDTTVNPPPQLTGPARPQFVFRDRDYWLQGINLGMTWDF